MRIDMELGSRSYPILVERGCLNRLGSLANLQRNILVVTDTGVPKPLVEAALAQCPQGHLITLPQGEGSKSLAAFETLLTRMLALGFSRTSRGEPGRCSMFRRCWRY